jgi:hypothetical protein
MSSATFALRCSSEIAMVGRGVRGLDVGVAGRICVGVAETAFVGASIVDSAVGVTTGLALKLVTVVGTGSGMAVAPPMFPASGGLVHADVSVNIHSSKQHVPNSLPLGGGSILALRTGRS